MHPLLKELLSNKPVITDGAWGTQLAPHLQPGKPAELLNLNAPDVVESVARAYAEAGSQVVLTNTFNASRPRLKHFKMEDQVVEINRCAAGLSRRGAQGQARVFASMGPSGTMLMMGDIEEEELEDAFSEQAMALQEGGADALVIETMADLEEALCALRGAKKTGLPVVACMVFDSGQDKDHTMMGVSAERAAKALTDAGADAIGANCGLGIEEYVPVCAKLRANSELPVWIKANAGLPETVDGKTSYRMTPEKFAQYRAQLVDAGADFIGGCCGTTPEFIRMLAQQGT